MFSIISKRNTEYKNNLIGSFSQLTDGTIQKLKQQYNQSGGPALEVTLAEVQEDLKIRPPKIIDNLDEVLLSNGIGNGHVEQGPGSGKTLDQTPERNIVLRTVTGTHSFVCISTISPEINTNVYCWTWLMSRTVMTIEKRKRKKRHPESFLWLSLRSPVQNVRLEPVTAPGILSLVLNIMCAALNVIRGVHLVEYTLQVSLWQPLPSGFLLSSLL